MTDRSPRGVSRRIACRLAWLHARPATLVGVAAVAVLAGCGGGGGSSQATTSSSAGAATSGGSGLVAEGRTLYSSKGCSACHSLNGSPRSGPTWKGLAGSHVKLAHGSKVTADDQYLTSSIEQPDKQIVAGYGKGIMSGTIPPGSISQSDAKALVAYIKSVK